jgi:predicted phosphodiesterase
MQKMIEDFLRDKKGYLKKGSHVIAEMFNIEGNFENIQMILNAIKKVKSEEEIEIPNYERDLMFGKKETKENTALEAIEFYLKNKDYANAEVIIKSLNKENKEDKYNVLVVGDIHEPFCKPEYLSFCKEQYDKFKCNKVVFIGDIIDNCYSSFHNSDPDGYAAGEELDRAINAINKWYIAFPEATVILGNHDRLAYRKAFSGGISSRWLRSYGDILNTPNWTFVEREVINDVLYIHGEAGTARSKCKDISQSVVQGHLHSQAYCEFINNRNFAVQVGCGIDDSLYAFNYGKAGKESIMSCAVVLEGTQPLLLKMN